MMTDALNACPLGFPSTSEAGAVLEQCRDAARLLAGFPLFDDLVAELILRLSELNNAATADRLIAVADLREFARIGLRHIVAPPPAGLSDIEIEGFVGRALAAALDRLTLMPATVGRA
jgi:hypothetical protein